MTITEQSLSPDEYGRTLAEFLRTQNEASLYRASQLSQIFIESGLGPEDIIALHCQALDQAVKNLPTREKARALSEAHQFLLEVMIAYGVRYKEYLELRLKEAMRDAESRAARERERAMELDRLQREKSEILGVIAHELRTPITAARGNLDLAVNRLSKGKVETVPRLLSSAREALDRLTRLTGDLVEASRGVPPELPMRPLRLSAVVAQACSWARPMAASKGIVLTGEGADTDIALAGNADALLSVFGNLLSNAVRYTPPGGKVTVRQGVEGEWAWVEVSDTGIGMPPEVQARIYEKFYRSAEARRQEARGLGLGLSLVQQMVQAHHGRIEVQSAPGQGSTFRVFLPLNTARRRVGNTQEG